MQDLAMGFFGMLVCIIVIIIASWATNPHKRRGTSRALPEQNQEQSFTPEEIEFLNRVKVFVETENITQKDVDKYNLRCLSEEFASMPGWSIWDESIHQSYGQLDRVIRSIKQDLTVIAYDPVYKFAKVRGSQFDTYLTSSARCSCPDYRKRKLPCKHMYSLFTFLDGDIKKSLIDPERKPLYRLNIALAGHFSGSRDGSDGFRANINLLGGVWSDDIMSDTHILVCGNGSSRAKLERAEREDIETLSVNDINTIFQVQEL